MQPQLYSWMTYVTVFWKINHLPTKLKPIFSLYMIDTLMHYPETPSTRQQIARSAFNDSFLPILSSHEGAFHGHGWH